MPQLRVKSSPSPSTPVLLVITPGVLLLDFAAIAEPLRIANRIAERDGMSPPPFGLQVVAPQGVTGTSMGIEITGASPLPMQLPGTVSHPAWIMLSGVSSTHGIPAAQFRAAEHATIEWLRMVVAPALTEGRTRLWTVCSGAILAARAGLLDGRQCTTHHDLTQALKAAAPRAVVHENRIYVIDGNVATSAGVTAGLDLALAAIAQHCGAVIASAVARDMVVYWRRTGADCQHSALLNHRNHMHPAVHRAQDAVLARPQAHWSVDAIAEHAFVSARHLRRLFAENAGVTPLAYVSSVRVALAREMLASQSISVEHAATQVGFSSARQLRDAWKLLANDLPSDVIR